MFQTVELEKIRMGMQMFASKEMMDANVLVDCMGPQIKMFIEGAFLSEKKPVYEETVKYPMDWKEALKERFLPGWLKERFPVVYTTVKLRVLAVYPDFKPALREQRYVFLKELDYENMGGLDYLV